MYTRRHFGKLAMAALPVCSALGKITSKIHGVQMGVAGYSYNTLPRQGLLDVITRSMVESGIGDCLLFAPSTEPVDLADKARPARGGRGGGGRGPANPEQAAALEALHQWHLTVPLTYYTAIRKKFSDAGLEINSFDASFGNMTSDEDLSKACEVTKALGASCMMCAVTKSAAKRLAGFAESHNIRVALQGRPSMRSTDPDIMAKPADFEEVFGYSKNFGSSIDAGDATGGGWDALKFIEDTHQRVFGLNLKDRTKANVSLPWGDGDTHIRDILQLVRDKKYPIRCYIDCDYALPEGSTRQAEVKRCMEFARAALT